MKASGLFRLLAFIAGGFLLFNLIWQICASALHLNVLPPPLAVYADYARALDNEILGHALTSLRRAGLALLLSLFLALLFGVPMGYSPAVNRLLGPLLYFSYPIPKLALIPAVMLLLGLGEVSKIAIITLIIVLQLTLSVRDAVRAVPEEDYALLTSLKAGFADKFGHIIFPAALPALLSSLRVSVGIAFSALFFTETFGTDKGLGFYITDCWMRLDYIQMYFGILLLSFLGFFCFLAADLAERVLCPWKKAQF